MMWFLNYKLVVDIEGVINIDTYGIYRDNISVNYF